MSVEKVNKYKDSKKNRKQELEQERKKQALYRFLGYAALVVVCVAFIVMIGITAKNQYTAYKASQPDYTADTMVVSDMVGILDDLEAEETADSTEASTEAAESETAEEAETTAAESTAAN